MRWMERVPVACAACDARNYAQEGGFTVKGEIDSFAGEFVATVVVGPAVVSSVLPVEGTGLAGYAPVLPAQVECIFADGSTETSAVVWEAMDPADYQSAGSFTVRGAVDALEATANVTVYAVESIETVIVANPQGKYPALPSTVKLAVSGQAAPLSWPVAWQPVAKANY